MRGFLSSATLRYANRSLRQGARKTEMDADMRFGSAARGLLIGAVFLAGGAAPVLSHGASFLAHELPDPYAERDPSYPGESALRAGYRSVTEDARSFRPVEPLPWSDINKRVTPPAEPEKAK